MVQINVNDIRRHGITIMLGQGYTATEGLDGNLATLTIRRNGKIVKFYRGSSLSFSHELTDEDKTYLASLCE